MHIDFQKFREKITASLKVSPGHFGHFGPDFCIKSHLIPAQRKQNFEIKTVGVSRYNETRSLNVQNATVKFTFEKFSFFSF